MISYLGRLGQHKEISIVVLILITLAMIIIPIPHLIMDIIIGFNIGITIIVLMVVIYMHSPLEITSFPSILLVLTLLRIGITISSSRLILLDGDAGQIISTFGEFVVGGNLIVGVIIFTIITLINFIVITKGSERVAEVAARFSLDAMPGKQMSIDSDLKANNIDMNEAHRQRNVLGLESKLYGAMDGAMKFVKGDAIASIIDIVVNLLGGLVIGMLQKNLSFTEALSVYSILTVGDGLVQQVPALLISMTAGIMITQVSDNNSKEKENLGTSILSQLFKNPKAILAASILFIMLSLVPGMPSTIFLIFFISLAGIGLWLQQRNRKSSIPASDTTQLIEESAFDQAAKPDGVSWKLQPLILNVSSHLKDSHCSTLIKNSLIYIHQEIMRNLGVEIPQIVIRYSENLDENCYELHLFEVPISQACLYPEYILILNTSPEILAGLEVGEDYIINEVDIGTVKHGIWIPANKAAHCEEFDIPYLTLDKFISSHLSLQLQSSIAAFLGMQEVKNMLDKMSEFQELIKELLRMLPLNKITEIFQRLVAEGISIRNFKVILDALLEWAQREKETVVITEYVRQALGRYIAYKYTQGKNILPCFLIDPDIEDMLRDSIRFNEGGSYLSIDPNQTVKIVSATQEFFEQYSHLKIMPVVITQMDIRRYLRSVLEKDLPFAHVVSFQEVEAYIKFNTLGVIEI